MRRFMATIGGAAILVLASQAAQAFVDPPTLAPANPVAGQPVSVAIRAGACDLMSADFATVTQTGGTIHLVAQSGHSDDLEFCTYPTLTATYQIGTFSAGSYTVQVDRQYPGSSGLVTERLGILAFSIAAAANVTTAPALNLWGLLALAAAMMIVAIVALKRRHLLGTSFFLLAAMLPLASQSQPVGPIPPPPPTLEVLLSARAGAPTPDQVISYFGTSGHQPSATPPLQSLAAESPRGASYLIPVRAQGDFAAYLQNNPSLVRAKLERYVVIQYPQGANINNAIAAFRNDSNVEAVYAPSGSENFSSVTLGGFGVSTSPAGPISSGSQYGRDDLNVDAAWQIAGGYALIGDADTGLYTAHPALVTDRLYGAKPGSPNGAST